MLSRILTAFRNVFGFEAGLSREQIVNQICLLIFVPAAIVVMGLTELQRFATRFWIALALAGICHIVSTKRLELWFVLIGVCALRYGIAFLKRPDLDTLLVTLVLTALTWGLLYIGAFRE